MSFSTKKKIFEKNNWTTFDIIFYWEISMKRFSLFLYCKYMLLNDVIFHFNACAIEICCF